MSFRHVWFLLSVIALSASAQSPQPQEKAKQGKTAPATEQRGTKNNPLAVQIVPGPDAAAQTANEESYRNEQAKQNRRIADATVWLAVITAILATFTGGLWLATYLLVRGAQETSKRQLRAYV